MSYKINCVCDFIFASGDDFVPLPVVLESQYVQTCLLFEILQVIIALVFELRCVCVRRNKTHCSALWHAKYCSNSKIGYHKFTATLPQAIP